MNSRITCILALLCFITTLCTGTMAAAPASNLRRLGRSSSSSSSRKPWYCRYRKYRSKKACQNTKKTTTTTRPRFCCQADTATCNSCKLGQTVAQYCRRYPFKSGCENPFRPLPRPLTSSKTPPMLPSFLLVLPPPARFAFLRALPPSLALALIWRRGFRWGGGERWGKGFCVRGSVGGRKRERREERREREREQT